MSDKWDRHWEWLQQSEWGPRHTWLEGTGTCSGGFEKAQRGDTGMLCTPLTHGSPVANMKAWQGGQGVCLAIEALVAGT